jgi:acetyltransferase-like isoleucine patch superfamily enzyme
MNVIHPTACVSSLATLGNDVNVGAYTIIHDHVILGDRVTIGAFCELGIATPLGDGTPLIISNDSLIRSHSIFYASSVFGAGLVTGHHATVRENTVAGEGFQIGTLCEIQGDCDIGAFVRFQSNVFVSKKTKIGNYVWVLPYVVFTNDPTPPSDQLRGCVVEDFVSICASSTLLPGITLGQYSLVAAGACVTKNVPAHMAVAGVPAKIIGEAKSIMKRDGSGEPAYPWTNHFHRGYPEKIVNRWKAEQCESAND